MRTSLWAGMGLALVCCVLLSSPASATSTKTWTGTRGGDVFDLTLGSKRADRVYAKAGRDYIIMTADGKRDVIRCGGGRDLVHYTNYRERRDVYIGCERIESYSP